tara:strand:- start:476 stop:826 length:351 start_codon:yes stop_codon:yes gene_type:complete
MALTITSTKRNNVSGTKVTAYVTAVFDDSYPAGGEVFDATTYIKNIDEVRITNIDELGYVVRYDATNKKLKVFASDIADDQTSVVPPGETAPFPEAKATTDLATLTVDLIIIGSRA